MHHQLYHHVTLYHNPAPNDDYSARIEATTAKLTPQPLSHICWQRATTLLVSIWQGTCGPSRSAKKTLIEDDAQIPTMTMIYRRNRKSVISSFISYLIHAYRVFNHLMRLYDFLSVSPLRMCVYFTFLHLVSYLITINQQCPIWLTHWSIPKKK